MDNDPEEEDDGSYNDGERKDREKRYKNDCEQCDRGQTEQRTERATLRLVCVSSS